MKEMKEQIINVKGAPLIKFQDKEKIEFFRKGNIYFKSLEYYRNKEKEEGDDVVGDMYEAMANVTDGYILIPEKGVFCLSKELLETKFSNHYAFCMFKMDNANERFTFSNEQKDKISTFGDYALLITDYKEFLMRVLKTLVKENIEGYIDNIIYYDESIDSIDYWLPIIQHGLEKIAFSKRKKYSYQQEFRLLIKPPVTKEDYFVLDIGSIEDISVILTVKQVMEMVMQPRNA